VPVIRGNNLSTNLTEFVAEDFAFVTEQRTRDKYKNCLVRPGDLVFTCWGTIGQVGRIPDDGPFDEYVISNKQLKLRTDPSIANSKFVYYYVASKAGVNYIKSRSIGAAVPGINLGIMKSIPIALPPMTLQESIVGILSAYDDLIENNRRRIQLLEQAARLLYKEWFVHLRFPGHEHVLITDGVPKGWEKKPLSYIADTNVESYKAQGLPDEINYIDISSVAKGRIVTKTTMLSTDAPGRARRKAKSGDVIWSNVRPNLRAYALVLESEENDVFSTGFTVLSPVAVPFSYLYLLVTTDEFVGHLVNHATGVSYPAVRPEDFERAIVHFPSKVVLELFHEKTEPIFRLISKLIEEAKGLSKACDLLLPRLMSGELAV
jgi:type I restriction enzyme S subunit